MGGTVVIWPIIAALVKAAFFLGVGPLEWHAVNQQQQNFLDHYFVKRKELNEFSSKEIRSWASKSDLFLNTILKKEGFSIQLKPFSSPNEFGVVSILDVYVEWIKEGEISTITFQEKNYPSVTIKQDFSVFSSPRHVHPIAAIKTKPKGWWPFKSQDVVWMTVANKPLSGFKLLDRIHEIRRQLAKKDNYTFVTFPMVDLNQEENVSWLCGMTIKGSILTQALQQTRFKMNELGARAKSAVAIALFRSALEEGVVIDRPFYIWIERPGVSEPIFAAYITENFWKNPGSLAM